MKVNWIFLTTIIVVWLMYFAQMFWAWLGKTLSRTQGKVEMSFWRNWAVSVCMPLLLAPMNGLMMPVFLSRGMDTALIYCCALGIIFDVARWRNWKKNPEENTGHIMDKNGKVTDSGIAFWIFFIPQTILILRYIFLPVTPLVAFHVGLLFFLFLVIQNLQAAEVQGSFNRRNFILVWRERWP